MKWIKTPLCQCSNKIVNMSTLFFFIQSSLFSCRKSYYWPPIRIVATCLCWLINSLAFDVMVYNILLDWNLTLTLKEQVHVWLLSVHRCKRCKILVSVLFYCHCSSLSLDCLCGIMRRSEGAWRRSAAGVLVI